MKKLVLVIVLIVVAAGAAYVFLNQSQSNAQTQSAQADATESQAGPGAQQPLSLQALRLQPRTINRYEELPGRTTAFKVAEIRPQVSGIVTERLFTEGSLVEEGQQLYQIDPATYEAAYDRAVADLRKAEANVASAKAKNKRYEELLKVNAVSRQEYEDIKTNLAQAESEVGIAEAAIKQAKVNLDYTKVYAPITGVIGKSSVTKGALVTGGQEKALARLTQLDPIYVDMNQSSADLMRLRAQVENYQNIPVTLFLDQQHNLPYEHKGRLQFYDVTVDASTGTVQLRAIFDNPQTVLLPGLFVRARLELVQPDALLVPQHAATRQPDGSLSVWRFNEQSQQVEPVSLTTSGAVDGHWIVAEGVSAGDVVMTEGLIKLQPGIRVKPQITEPEPVNNPVAPEPGERAEEPAAELEKPENSEAASGE